MTRGRKPKPAYMRVLEGGSKGKAAEAAAALEATLPKVDEAWPPPDWMSEEQQTIWRDAVKAAPPGLLTVLDTSVLEAWVIARDRFIDAAKRTTKFGSLLASKAGGHYQNPYLAIQTKQSEKMAKLAAELGFTPSSRSRVKLTKNPTGGSAANPFGDLKTLADD